MSEKKSSRYWLIWRNKSNSSRTISTLTLQGQDVWKFWVRTTKTTLVSSIITHEILSFFTNLHLQHSSALSRKSSSASVSSFSSLHSNKWIVNISKGQWDFRYSNSNNIACKANAITNRWKEMTLILIKK